jgi:hypothetical protein
MTDDELIEHVERVAPKDSREQRLCAIIRRMQNKSITVERLKDELAEELRKMVQETVNEEAESEIKALRDKLTRYEAAMETVYKGHLNFSDCRKVLRDAREGK